MRTTEISTSLILLATTCCAGCPSVGVPHTVEEVAGVYIGQMNDGPETYCRLELRTDGTGLCAWSSDWRTIPRLYEATDWRLDKWNIRINLRQVDTRAASQPIELCGRAYGSSLKLEARILKHENAWDRFYLKLRRESGVLETYARLQKQMEDPSPSPK